MKIWSFIWRLLYFDDRLAFCSVVFCYGAVEICVYLFMLWVLKQSHYNWWLLQLLLF